MTNNVEVIRNWRGAEILERAKAAAEEGLIAGVEYLAYASKIEVPVDTGTLERSCDTDYEYDDLEGIVYYDTPYAVRQHEDLDYHHPFGKAKYLEDPLYDHEEVILDLIASAIRRGL